MVAFINCLKLCCLQIYHFFKSCFIFCRALFTYRILVDNDDEEEKDNDNDEEKDNENFSPTRIIDTEIGTSIIHSPVYLVQHVKDVTQILSNKLDLVEIYTQYYDFLKRFQEMIKQNENLDKVFRLVNENKDWFNSY